MTSLKDNPNINQIRYGIVLVFVIFLGFNYFSGVMQRQDAHKFKLEKNKAVRTVKS